MPYSIGCGICCGGSGDAAYGIGAGGCGPSGFGTNVTPHLSQTIECPKNVAGTNIMPWQRGQVL